MEVEHGHEFDHTTPSNLKNMTADEAGTWILEHTPDSFQVLIHVSLELFAILTNFWLLTEDDGYQLFLRH